MRKPSRELLATQSAANHISPVVYLLCLLIALPFVAAQSVSGQSTATFRIYLVRHGETDWNAEGRVQGGTDTALNATGRRQAVDLASRIKGVRLDAVYSSGLRRSRDTAELVRSQAPLTSLVGLDDRKQGKFEGRRIDASDPDTAAEYKRRSADPDDALDGGESLNQLFERVRATIGSIRKQHSTGTILIVGHFITNQMILRALLNLTAEQAQSINQSNDEVYMLELDSGNPPRLWKMITETNLSDL
jgi:probable phosphoglycerate mutase